MILLPEATQIGVDLVLSKAKHPDYKHAVELSEGLYRPLATGKGIEALMRRFDPREDETWFKQRVAITQHTTPSTWNTLLNPIKKLESVRPVVDRMEWEPENAQAAEKVAAMLKKFRGNKTVDHYISSLTELSELDPNAFELIVFDPFDPRFEVPQPYAVSVSSRDAWNFEYFNDQLRYLWVHRDIKYIAVSNDGTGKPVMKDGHRFVIYVANHHIVFEQVRPELAGFLRKGELGTDDGQLIDGSAVTFGTETGYFLRVNENEAYRVTFFDQQSGQVPAFRLGSVKDPRTDGRTCVNTIHPAMDWMMKMVKYVSEMDLTVCLHVFPKKWQYAPACSSCSGGKTPDGKACGTCKGSGRMPVIGSAQEVNTLAMPDRPEDMFDLTKMVFYEPTDIAVIQELREQNKEIREMAIRAVYAGDMFTKDQVNVTATAKTQELDSAYSALRPRIRWREEVKPTIVHVSANYLDSGKGLSVTTIMPQNLRYETEGDVVALMKESAPVAGRAFMASKTMDLIHRAYTDDPVALKRAITRERFNPFAGMSEGTILSLISGGQTSKEDEVMWTQMETIFDQAEQEHKGEVSLYDLAPDKLRTIIFTIRDERVGNGGEELPVDATLGTDENDMSLTDTGANADPSAGNVQDTALNGAQITSLLEVITLASTGAITKETARAIIDAAFPGINAAQVNAMFANMKLVDPGTVRAAAKVADPGNSAGADPNTDPEQEPEVKPAA